MIDFMHYGTRKEGAWVDVKVYYWIIVQLSQILWMYMKKPVTYIKY